MHRAVVALAGLALASGPVALAGAPVGAEARAGCRVGEPAPQLRARTWLNHLGQEPSLERLRGRAVLVAFWATWSECSREGWPLLQALHDAHEEEGLVVLALTDEDPARVDAFLAEHGFSVRSGARSPSGPGWGVTTLPTAVLIDPQGLVAWRGDLRDVPEVEVRRALARASVRGAPGPLELATSIEQPGPIAPAVAAARAGDLGKALRSALALADGSRSETTREAARELIDEIELHVEELGLQVEEAAARLQVRAALRLNGALETELAGRPAGRAAAARRERLLADPRFRAELEAVEAFERARRTAGRLCSEKARRELGRFLEEYPEARVAARARALENEDGRDGGTPSRTRRIR